MKLALKILVLQLSILLLGAAPALAQAKPFVHQLFSNNMVLQRGAGTDAVWGWTTPGASVTVAINTPTPQSTTVTADANGRWQAAINQIAADGVSYTLTVTSGSQSKSFTNVLFGDVILCSGQSNMAFNLNSVTNSAAEIADSANYPKIRCFNVPTINSLTAQDNLTGGAWNVAGPTTTGGFTAVGYFMAREMFKHDSTVPIGLVNAPWSGSTLESWLNRATAEGIADFTQTLWDQDAIGLGFDSGPGGDVNGNVNPVTGHYNGLIHPLAPYQFRAAIWYQGESNAGRGEQYQRMLPLMMSNVRTLFGANLPFVIVQLVTQSGTGIGFADIREAQEKVVAADATRCRLVTALDLGTADWNLHPPDKQDVGLRASWAMRNLIYGESIACKPPTFTSATASGSSITCTFSDVGSGLMVGAKDVSTPLSAVQPVTGGTLTGFTIAGADRVFQAATATISGANTVSVSSAGVATPLYVRYNWSDKAGGNLYAKITDAGGNTNGLPVGSFRSDPTWRLSANFASGSSVDYSSGLAHTVTATAPSGMVFNKWTGDVASTTNPLSVTVSQRYVSVRAEFQITTTPSFTVGAEPGRNVISWVPFAAPGVHYTVKRGTASGGPFTAIASNLVGKLRYEDRSVTNGAIYYYTVVGVNEVGEGPVGTAQAATTIPVVRGLAASAGTASVALSWSSVSGALSYDVARSTTSGGPYEVIATGVTGLTFTDQSVGSGQTYYYVVTATTASGTTPASDEASAAPSFLPPPFSNSQDVGAVGLMGSATATGSNQMTLQGSGVDISHGAEDQFRFAYTPVTGDCTITTRVASIQNTDSFAKAGVMLRATLATGSAYAMALRWGNQTGVAGLYRLLTDSTQNLLYGGGANFWLRVTRVGNVFTTYSSPDGSTWTQLGTAQTIAMPSTIYAGLAVCAHNNTILNTAVFDNISINGSALQSAQTPQALAADVRASDGNVLLRWNAVTAANSYNVKRATASGGPYTTVASVSAATQYAPVGLTSGATYYFTVSAVTGMGEGSASNVVTVNVPVVSGPTPVPSGVTVLPGNGQVTLKWSGSALATSFTVSRATSIAGTYTSLGTFTASQCTDAGLTNGTTYYYTVVANAPAGAGASSAPVVAVPGYPSQFAALVANADVRYVSAVGTAALIPNATGISASETFEFLDLGSGLTALRSVASGKYVTTLLADTKLYATATSIGTAEQFAFGKVPSGGLAFKAQANAQWVAASSSVAQVLLANGTNGNPAFTQVFQLVALPSQEKPTGLNATPAPGQVTLRWNAMADITSYTVKRATSVGGSYTTLGTVTGNSYTDASATSGTTYFYVVSAAKGSSAGVLSDPVGATPLAAFLNSAGWLMSASISPTTAQGANDGSMSTRWTSGASTATGQWFQVDLGTPQTFSQVVMDQGTATNDYPAGYEVYVSNDGINWGSPVATGAGTPGMTTATFASQTARYIRVVRTGAVATYWSIFEFRVSGVATPPPLLGRSGWTFSASASGGSTPPANAGDGSSATNWSTGAAQANGQWFQIDMGIANTVGQLILDPGSSAGEYPRGYQVKVSNDGTNWGNAVATGSGAAAGPTTINLAPQTVRYVRITQTGTATNPWSIYELNAVGAPMQAINRTGWTTSASLTQAGTATASVLDGNTGTRWSTGIAQASGQWFQVDMGVVRSFSQIVFDAAASANDFPRNYEVYVSNDGVSWGRPIATGAAASTISTIPFPQQIARYVRVVQTGSAGNFWTIYELNVYDTPSTTPSAPTGLTATGGNAQMALSWTASAGGVSYSIKRATTSGGPYTTIATDVVGTSYTDASGVSNGATYYYVVSATNNAGTSSDSTASSATAAPLPSPWQRADIGSVGVAGNAFYVNPTFTLVGSGADISGSADAFRYVSQTSSGDCSIVARVTSQQNTDVWAKAGVMLRETTAANAINAAIIVTPGGINFQWRSASGGATSTTGGGAYTFPNVWLKLTRVGSSVSAYKSTDGTTWSQVGTSQTLAMATSATIGLAVTAHNNTVTSTATFDNVTAAP